MSMKYSGQYVVPFNFQVNYAAPLDNRTVVASINDLLTVGYVYKGLVASVTDENALYIFIGDETVEGAAAVASNWKRLDSGSLSYSLSYGTGNSDASKKTIKLLDGTNVISEIDASEFIKDGMVDGAEILTGTLDGDTFTPSEEGIKYLHLTFNTDADNDKGVYVALQDFVDVYTAGDGISIIDNKIALSTANKSADLTTSDSIAVSYDESGVVTFTVNDEYIKKLITENSPAPAAGDHITVTTDSSTNVSTIAVNPTSLAGTGLTTEIVDSKTKITLDEDYLKDFNIDGKVVAGNVTLTATGVTGLTVDDTTHSYTYAVPDTTVGTSTYTAEVIDAHARTSAGRKVEVDLLIDGNSITADANISLLGYKLVFTYKLIKA